MTKNTSVFRSKEVAKKIGVASVTIRKWSLKLEDKGYTFTRDEKDRRIYSERDLMAFECLSKRLKEELSLEKAAEEVAEQFKISPTSNDDIAKQLKDYIEAEQIFKEKLIQKIEQQEAFIKDKLAEFKRILEEHVQLKKEAAEEFQVQILVTKNG